MTEKYYKNPCPPYVSWLILLIILIVTVVLRYNLLDVPLERDEGEYAYAGQLILQGSPPYENIYNMKLPGIYGVYAVIMYLFGETRTGIHIGLLFFTLGTTVSMFLLTRKLAGTWAGLAAAATFAVLSVMPSMQGVFANGEHFVILPATAGLYFLLKNSETNKFGQLFLSGLLLGLAFIIKQHGVFFIAIGFMYIFVCKWFDSGLHWRHIATKWGIYALGAALPYAVTCLLLYKLGVFEKFWLWTMEYSLAYTSQVSFLQAWPDLRHNIVQIFSDAWSLWLLAGLGLVATFSSLRLSKKSVFVVIFISCSLLATSPGFYFRPHYFILITPVAALLVGMVTTLPTQIKKLRVKLYATYITLFIIICGLVITVSGNRRFLFQMTPAQASRALYWPNPFAESIEVAHYIKQIAAPTDRIGVIGSEPQLYFYTGLRSASGFIYMYPLMENHKFVVQMQEDMIREIETIQPEFLVFFRISYSWSQTKDSVTKVFDWYENYSKEYYTRVAFGEIHQERSFYSWDSEIRWPPRSPYWFEILQRKN